MKAILLFAFLASANGFQTTQVVSPFTLTASRSVIGSMQQQQSRAAPQQGRYNVAPFKKASSIQASSSSRASDDASRKVDSLFSERNLKTARSVAAFVFLDLAFQRTFAASKIAFPHSLAGCAALLTTLLLAPKDTARELHEFLRPGANFFATWLPVLFVPSLITLPLAMADHTGAAQELIKLSMVVAGGFCFTLLSTAMSVTFVRKLGKENGRKRDRADTMARDAESGGRGLLQDAKDAVGDAVESTIDAVSDAANEATPDDVSVSLESPKPFSQGVMNNLSGLSAASGVAAAAASMMGSNVARPLTSLFLLFTTLSTFCFGARMPRDSVKLVHPLVTCTGLTWAAAAGFGALTGKSFHQMLRVYKSGTLQSIYKLGAGDLLLFMLGPAVVSLAISMYSKRQLVKDNLLEVGTAVSVSTAGGLFGTALAVKWLNIASPYLRLSLLSRNITSPLAAAMAGILGANLSFAVSIVVITGLIGANFGANLLDAFDIKDPVARGLSMGAAAHGLGTAAIVKEKDAFPFAAISMALTASAATVAVSVPVLRKMILQIALG
ncbi:hypothetical protein MPSEU_000661300 [Mayamaea pseudoterrestris]|nr:hypothetical protein MPSEU_000661300 [Mayamaea pseudoterrestris]